MKQVNILKVVLKDLYQKKKLSMAKIAKRFRCTPGTIQRVMRRYGIKSRTLSEAAKEVFIPKLTLRQLYYQKKLSTDKIAKLYHCSHATILNIMKIYKLKRRSRLGLRKHVVIPKKTLRNLYEKQKLSQVKIARRIQCSICAIQKLMKKYNIKSRSLSEAQMKHPKKNFGGELIEKAYLIGFRLGDLRVIPAKLQIQVDCSTTVQEQTNLIKDLFRKYTKIIIKQNRFIQGKLVTDIRCLLNRSFNFLLPKQDRIEPWILKNKKFFFSFSAGYIDAEGHIFVRLQKKSKTPIAGFQVQSYDKKILHQTWSKLKKLGIKCPKPLLSKPKGYESKLGFKNKEDMWRLSVNRKDALFKLLTSIKPFIKHRRRKQHLKKAMQNLRLRLKNRRTYF